MASAGIGSGNHIFGELFQMMSGVHLVHVPYRGAGPALVDLLGGQVQIMFASMPSSIEYVRAGRLRALAVTTAMRSPVLPDIPMMSGRHKCFKKMPQGYSVSSANYCEV